MVCPTGAGQSGSAADRASDAGARKSNGSISDQRPDPRTGRSRTSTVPDTAGADPTVSAGCYVWRELRDFIFDWPRSGRMQLVFALAARSGRLDFRIRIDRP